MVFEHTISIEIDDDELEEMASQVAQGYDIDDVFYQVVTEDFVECDYIYDDMKDKIFDEIKKRVEKSVDK